MTSYSIFGSRNSAPPAQRSNTIDDDEQTVMASENRTSTDREMQEICLKWVFPATGDKKKALQSHYSMLGMIMKAYPDLVIIDNKAREHTERKSF